MEDFFVTSADPSALDHAQPVARLMYASQANIEGSIYSEMERIRASALRHNKPAGVATALLYQSGWFAQWKEGPREAVLGLMGRINADPRHHSLCVVHSSVGPRLLSGLWSMAIVQCADPATEMAQRVHMLERDLKQGRQYSPPAVWRRLSTPMRHPGAAHQAEPDAFQRVLVCAARGTASFTLVERLAQHKHEEVVHRRFAGERNLDVGTDYVDFADGGRVMRLIAMARNGLSLPLSRAFLPDYSHIVLLLSGERDRDLALVERVAHGCAGIASPPHLLGVSQDAAGQQELSEVARHSGLVYLDIQGDVDGGGACWRAIRPHLDSWRHSANSSVWPIEPLRFG